MSDAAREALVATGRYLSSCGLAHGTSGNLSVRLGDSVLVTPTNSRLGGLTVEDLSEVGLDGTLLSGARPSKETPLHLDLYRGRPDATAVVHLHSVCAVAVSCLRDVDPQDAFPPLTAYSLMRLGKVPVVPFHPPGSAALAEAVGSAATGHTAMLLANHGSLVAGRSLKAATADAEELEQTARLMLLLRGQEVRPVPAEHVAELRAWTP